MDRQSLFLQDLKRLHAQSIDRLRAVISCPAGEGRETAVRRFFDAIHTYKGTAGMVKGYEEISRHLHALEGRLATRPAAELAREGTWLSDANKTLLAAHSLLLRKIGSGVAPQPPSVKSPNDTNEPGVLAIRASGSPLWIPISSILGFLPREEFASKKSVMAAGRWVPVLAGARDEIAVISKVAAGIIAVGVREIVGVRTRAEAAASTDQVA